MLWGWAPIHTRGDETDGEVVRDEESAAMCEAAVLELMVASLKAPGVAVLERTAPGPPSAQRRQGPASRVHTTYSFTLYLFTYRVAKSTLDNVHQRPALTKCEKRGCLSE